MGQVPPKSSKVQNGKVGVESAHGFGDGLFNAALVKAISEKHGAKVAVAVRPHCKDAFYNLPFVSEIIEIENMNHGVKKLRQLGFEYVYQITQNVKFFEFKGHDNNHSLIDTPMLVGRQLGINHFDNRPLFIPTEQERQAGEKLKSDKPTIAIESVYKSAQSWAQPHHIARIVAKFKDTHRIMWLSNEGAPKLPNVHNMLGYTRRECIMCMQHCDIFFSVGSGFFCASLALPRDLQPKRTICLWTDNLYRYEKPLGKLQWNPAITWVHNDEELNSALESC